MRGEFVGEPYTVVKRGNTYMAGPPRQLTPPEQRAKVYFDRWIASLEAAGAKD